MDDKDDHEVWILSNVIDEPIFIGSWEECAKAILPYTKSIRGGKRLRVDYKDDTGKELEELSPEELHWFAVCYNSMGIHPLEERLWIFKKENKYSLIKE